MFIVADAVNKHAKYVAWVLGDQSIPSANFSKISTLCPGKIATGNHLRTLLR